MIVAATLFKALFYGIAFAIWGVCAFQGIRLVGAELRHFKLSANAGVLASIYGVAIGVGMFFYILATSL